MLKKASVIFVLIIVALSIFYLVKNEEKEPTNSTEDPSISDEEPTQNNKDESNHEEPRITVEEMALDEKIGQMIFAGLKDTEPNNKMNNLIHTYKVGGIIFSGENFLSTKQTISYLNQIQLQNVMNPLPIMFGVDQEGGRIYKLPGDLVKLPTNLEIGKMKDPTYSYEIGSLLGNQLHAFGFHMDFAPVLDVNSNPQNPIIGDRSFGNNPDIVSSLGIQTMKGIQSQDIISVVKHFPGHGDTSVDSHLELPEVNKTRSELENMELIPFKRAISDGADVVMVGHILLPEIDPIHPSTMSEKIIQGILRKDLGFNGVVITDDMTMKAITDNYGIGEAAVLSVTAGSDIIMVAHDYNKVVTVIDAIKAAVENGEISEERINESVNRVLELKKKYNIQNESVKSVDIDKLNQLANEVLKK